MEAKTAIVVFLLFSGEFLSLKKFGALHKWHRNSVWEALGCQALRGAWSENDFGGGEGAGQREWKAWGGGRLEAALREPGKVGEKEGEGKALTSCGNTHFSHELIQSRKVTNSIPNASPKKGSP